MEAGMSVSLLRDQLGAVIEQAVTAAVETVLGEMAKVVSSRFEEFRKEMSAKEKENESIKQMLEISRCQMKMMRKYLSAVAPKDECQAPGPQPKGGQQSEPPGEPGAMVAESRSCPQPKRTLVGDDGSSGVSEKRQNAIPKPGDICLSEGLLKAITWDKVPTNLTNGQECSLINAGEDMLSVNGQGVLRGDLPAHVSHVKVEYRDSEVDDRFRQSQDGREPPRGARPPLVSQVACAAALEPTPSSLHKAEARAVAGASSPKVWAAPFQAKEEEAAGDIEIVCIKEEPEDLQACPLGAQGPSSDAGTQGCQQQQQQQRWPERPSGPSAMRPEGAAAAYTAVACAAYAPRPARRRQWLKDPSVCEDYKHRRAELKRRSQHRRRELEKNLPQPLLAALVRERREKTRLRVARWRAKRKLQAGLMAPGPPQLAGAAPPPPPALHIPHATDSLLGPRQPVAAPQYGSLLYGSGSHGDTGTRYPGLPFGSHHLLSGLRRNATTAVPQPGLMSSMQQGMMGTDSEAFPKSLS